jgi:acetyl-CoA C-acetyltransferase
MTDPHTVPVIIGVGDLAHGRAGSPAEPRQPLDLIADAVDLALADTGIQDVGSRVDAIHTVKTASWAHDDLPAMIAERIGAHAPRTTTSTIGGHWPAALLDRIGSDIASGASAVALLVGGEAQASVRALTKSGTDPASVGWVAEPGGPPAFSPDDLGSAAMQRAGAHTPTRVYPLFENRLGHDTGQTPAETLERSAQLYAAFSEVAASHPAAWSPVARTAEDIATVGPSNRRVSDAYPLSMNAMPFVDQAAAVVVCSLAVAVEWGVPDDRLVYLWGGAGASDTSDVLARNNFGESPALHSAVARTLDRAGVTSAALSLVDAYSCFPVVPKLLVRTLGLGPDTVPTVLGGHSFFGGPLNSYTLHAIVEVTRLLRAGSADDVALVHANGGYLTHQHTVLLARTEHRGGYIGDPVPVEITSDVPTLVHDYVGDVVIDAATIEYDRSGLPATALVIAHTPDGRRVAGHTGPEDAATLIGYTDDGRRSLVGAPIHVSDHAGLLEITIDESA